MEKIGLIPCAGKGSRLSLPFSKELFPNVHTLSYHPILLYTLNAMKKAGITHIVVTINHHKMDIIKFLGNGERFGIKISYCVHPEPLSLPHSIDEAYHLVKDKTVVFAMPDTIVQPPDFLKTLVNFHLDEKRSEATFAGFQTDNFSKFGMVEFNKQTGNISNIYDKPVTSELTWMWGAIVWNPVVTENIHRFVSEHSYKSDEKELVLTDAFKPLFTQKKVTLHCFVNGRYRDLGTYDEIRRWSKGEWNL